MRTPTLYILCGAPGSGKSTFAANYTNGHTIWVSRDAIRFRYLDKNPNAEYFEFEKEVFNDFIEEILQGLVNEYDVIADATHLNMKSRKKLTNAIDAYFTQYDIKYILFIVPVEVCIERNKKRSGRANVPEEKVREMAASLTIPSHEDAREKGMWTIEGEV